MSEIDSFLDGGVPAAPHSDIDSFLGGETKPQGKGVLGHVRDIGVSAAKSVVGVPEALVGLADIPTGGAVGKALENEDGSFGVRFKETQDILSDLYTDEYKEQQRQFSETDGVLDKASVALQNPSLITNTVVQSVGPMLAGGAIGKGAGLVAKSSPVVAGAIGEGAIMAGSQAEGIRQQTEDGLLTAGQSAAAAATGVMGGLFGYAGGRLAQKLGIGDVDTMLAGGVKPQQVADDLAQTPAKSVPRQVIEGAISEGFLEELPQSVSEQIVQNLALGKDWSEGVEDSAVMGTLAGMAMGGVGAGFAGVTQPKQEQVQPQPTPENPAPAPVQRPNPNAGPLSAAANLLPAPESDGTLYGDAAGNVSGNRPSWVNPENDLGRQSFGPGMDRQTVGGVPGFRDKPLEGELQNLAGAGMPLTAAASKRQPQTFENDPPRLTDGRQQGVIVDADGNAQLGKLPNNPPADYVQGGRGMDQQAPVGKRFDNPLAAKNAITKAPEPAALEVVQVGPKEFEVQAKAPVLQNRDRSTPASITQMREIAANPDYSRLGFSRDFANGAPVVEPGANVQPQNLGRSDVATTASGRRIPVQYAVVEAGSLMPSHDVNGSADQQYATGMKGKSRAIAGNGRVAGLRQAFAQGTAGEYVELMAGDANLHGISPAAIRSMKEPVLVRIMPREEITQDIGDESNTTGVSALSGAEQAMNDARRINIDDMEFSASGEISETTVRQFVQSMPKAEQGGLLDGSRPSRQAYDRAESAIFANAYESESLIRLQAQATDPEVRTVLSGLLMAAPKMARLKGAGAWDIRGLAVEAAEAAVNARRNGQTLEQFAQQIDLDRNPESQYFIKLFAANIRSAKRIGEELSATADLFYTEAAKPESDMFGSVPRRSRQELLNGAANADTTRTPASAQAAGNQAGPGAAAPGREEGAAERAEPAGAAADSPAEPAGQEFQLESYDEQQLAEQSRQKAEADAKAAAETKAAADKAQADRDRNDFTLTGSDRPSDVAAARGQNDMFAPPTRGERKTEQAQRNPVDYLREIVRQSNVPQTDAVGAARGAILNPDASAVERQALLEEVGATDAQSIAELDAALVKWWRRHFRARGEHKAKANADMAAFDQQRRDRDVEDTLELGRQAAADLDAQRTMVGEKKAQQEQAASKAPDTDKPNSTSERKPIRFASDQPASDYLADGSIIEDGKGQQYRVHYQRNDLVLAHPIIDGKAQVNADSSVRFHVGDPASADGRRTDPIYLVQARSNSGSLAEGGSKKGTSILESADEYAARLRSLADEFDGTYYGRSLSPVARAMADHAIESGRRMTDAELEGLARQHDVPLDVIEQLTGSIFTYDAVLGASQRGEAGATALLRRARGNAIGSAEAGAPAVEPWHTPLPTEGLELTRAQQEESPDAYRGVTSIIAADAFGAITPTQSISGQAMDLYYLPETGGRNGVARFIPEGQPVPDTWRKVEGGPLNTFGMTREQAVRKITDLLSNAAVVGSPAKVVKAKAAGKPKKQKEKASASIEDAGEKLGGARKDQLRTVRERLDGMDDEAIAGSSLSQLWPKGELDKISEPFEAALYHVVRGLIPAKPRVPYRVKGWVAKVKAAREILTRLGKMDAGATADKMRAFSPDLGIVADQIEVLMALDRKHWSRIDNVRRASGRYNQDGEMVPGSWVSLNIDGRNVNFFGRETVASAIPAIKERVEGKSAPEKRLKFAIYTDRQTSDVFVVKEGDAEMRRLKTFKTVKEARAFLNDEHEAAVALWDAVKNRDNVTKSDMRRAANEPRVGQDHRNGKDVTPEQFIEAFGFRGVEFGNWVKQGAGGRERQGMLNDAYDAFMDLAGILNIPPKALSLEGKLGIGFGSRGSGKASAHYEPDRVVINMTKTKGAGTLAHEWFHALDNYFARRRAEQPGSGIAMTDRETAYITYRPERLWVNKKHPSMRMTRSELSRYQTNHPGAPLYQEGNWEPDAKHPNGVRPQVEKAFAELVATLNASPMLQRAKVIDGKTSDGYWSRIIERGARSFETYVIARLADQGFRNDYLANVQTLEQFARDHGRYPYLTPDEQGPVNEAFDKLFATLETKETDLGVALFSRAGSPIDPDGLSESSVVTGKVPENPISLDEAIAAAEQFLSDYNGNIELNYRIRKKQDELYGPGSIAKIGVVKGAYHPGRGLFTLASDHLSSTADAYETLRHEILGHYGLDTFSPQDKQALLDKILASKEEPSLKLIWDDIAVLYADKSQNIQAEEVFARLAESPRSGKEKLADLLHSILARLLRKMFPSKKGIITRSELLREIEVISKGIRNGSRQRQTFESETKQRRGAQTETPAFKRWFGDSKVVDAEGKPLVVYHGSSNTSISEFSPVSYFSESTEDARDYAGSGATYPAYVRIENPYYADDTQDEENRSELTEIDEAYADELKKRGYDGVIGYRNGETLWAIPFDSKQIKSAIGNNGNFDPANPDIRYRLSGTDAKGIPLFSANGIAKKLQSSMGLRVKAVADESQLPEAVRAQIQRDGVSGRVAGVYHNGTSYLIASNLHDAKHAISTVLHEAVGHGGVKAVLGEQIGQVMRSIYRDMPAAMRSELERRYAGQLAGMTREAGQELVAEEYVAHLAEHDPRNGLLNRVVALIKQFIRQVFGADAAGKWTRADVVQLLAEAKKAAAGRGPNGGGSRYRSGAAADDGPAMPEVGEASEAEFVASLQGTGAERAFASAIYKARGTQSPFFQRWFGNSRMVNKEGRPMTFVHRSFGERDTFDDAGLGGNTGTATAALGHYLARTDVGNVERYGPVTERFYIRMEKPKVISQDQFEAMGDWSLQQVKAYRKTLMDQGYDGLYITGLAWPVVFEGKNIKAVRNVGTFDDSNSTRYGLVQDAEAFRREVERAMAVPGRIDRQLTVGRTPAVLRALGAPDLPIAISKDTILKASNGVKHDVQLDDIKRLPELLADPVMVFDSRTEAGALVVLIEVNDASGRPVVVAIHTHQRARHMEVNKVSSVHGRESGRHITGWIKDGLLRYRHTQKSREWFQSRGLQLPKEGVTRGLDAGDRPQSIGLQLPKEAGRQSPDAKVLTDADIFKGDSSPDIRYSLNSDAATREALAGLGLGGKDRESLLQQIRDMGIEGLKAKLSDWGQRSREGLFDGLEGIRRAEEAVGVTDPNQQGYVSARQAAGTADVLHAILLYGAPEWKDGIIDYKAGTRGLLEVLADLGQNNLQSWLGWLGGKRAELLKAQGRENNLSDQEIAELIALGKGKEALFEKVYQEYAALNEAILDLAEGAGIIDPKARAKWQTEYYVPFYREPVGEDAHSGPSTKRGLSHQSAAIRALKGGKLPTKDLLSNIMQGMAKRVDASMKNYALLEIVDNLKDSHYLSDESPRYQQVLISRSQIAQQVKKDRKALKLLATMLGLPESANFLKVANELMKPQNEGFEKLWTRVAPTDPDIIRVMRDGKPEYYRVNDESLLRGVLHMAGPIFNDPVTSLGRTFKRMLTTGVTASPEFILRNYIRDSVHNWMINPDGFKFGIDSIKGLQQAFAEDADFRAMMFHGSSFAGGYIHATDPEASAQMIRRALRQKGITGARADGFAGSIVNTKAKAAEVIKKGWEQYREWGDKVENANRLGVYKAALAAGKSKRQAAYEARDVMDFAMRGNFTAAIWLTDVVPFLNARMQGLYKLGRAMKGDKTLLAKHVAIKGGYVLLFSLLLAAANDDDERYQELPNWDKDLYWHIFLGDEHFRIPKPFELGLLFGTVPERMLHAATGTQSGSDLGRAVAHGVLDTLAFNPLPQVVKPMIEVVANRDFFRDTDIEGMADEGKVAEARYDERTSDISYGIGQVTGRLFNLSPKQVDHLIKGYTGTLGAYTLGVADLIANAVSEGESPDWHAGDLPLVRTLYQGDSVRPTQYQTEFYDALREADQLYRTVRAYREEGRFEEARELQADSTDKLRHRPALGFARRQLGLIRNQMESVHRDKDLSGEVKQQRLDDLQRRSNAIAEQIAKRVKDDF